MLRIEAGKWFRRMFSRGVNSDVDPNDLPDGFGTAVRNMRPSSPDGNTGSLKKIGGENMVFEHPTLPGFATYRCIGSVSVNGNLVSFWANTLLGFPVIVEVNGVIVAQSVNIPYVYHKPLQFAVVEECGDRQGIIFPADHWSDPLFWDVKDMLDALAAGQQTYFSAYTTEVNSVGLFAPPTIPTPKFPECIFDVGGTVGLPVGQYTYFIRYVTANGDRTNWSPATGLIPVPVVYTPNNVTPVPNYPRTIGGEPNILVPSQYGTIIQLRIDNFVGFASIEVGRTAYNSGGGITGLGVSEVIARLPIAPGELSIREFRDPTDANITPPEVIPPDEVAVQLLNIRKPKGVDYSDGRLKYANFMLDAADIALTFLDFAGAKMTAITKALTRRVSGVVVPDGYDNPRNCAVNKSAQRGGQAKYGIQFWDGAYGLYPAVNIPEPFTPGTDIFPFPQRRDIKGANGNYGADSETYSEGGPIYAATVDVASQTAEGPVGSTFEVFSQGDGVKTDTSRVVNVAKENGDTPQACVGRDQTQFNNYALGIPPQVTVSGSMVIPTGNGFQPWDPRNNQAETSGFNVPPNTSRFMDVASGGGAFLYNETPVLPFGQDFRDQCFSFNPELNNRGRCFAPTHHALGVAIAGIDSGIPTAARIMSVVYNGDTRGEIVAQGFGSWNLMNTPTTSDPNTISDYDPARKSTNSLRTFFPDVAAGIIDQALWDDIQQNPGDYQVRVVSPLPFYPEIYSYKSQRVTTLGSLWSGPAVMANLMDIMCHTSFLHDEGQVNVGTTQPCGYQPFTGMAPDGSYVGFDKWRRTDPMDGTPGNTNSYSHWQQQAATPFWNGQGGNAPLTLNYFQPRTAGRTTYYELVTDEYFYPPASDTIWNGFVFQTNVNGTQTRNFQGPWYVINIIRNNSTIPESNIEPYKNMGCHIALKQTIGIYNGGTQDYMLIGEREKYDCTNYLPTDYRYAYVYDPVNGERRYLCITGNTQITLAVVLLSITVTGSWIAPDGLPVYGVYESIVDNAGVVSLRFGTYTSPDAGSRIIIKYDNTAPIRAFGHDVTVAPVTHAVKDEYADTADLSNGNIRNLDVLAGLPFIHAGFGMNPRVFVPETDSVTDSRIYINFMGTIRQWCIMWSAESRVLPSMYLNINSTPTYLAERQQFFPALHYVMRPADGVNSSGFFDQYYVSDYPQEPLIYAWGGLRYLPATNLDYARQPDVGFFGYPRIGITYNDDYCTAIAASNQYDPTLSDSPGLRTFVASNMITLSEETGEIKVIATASSDALGQNTHFWTQKGHGYVLTNKNVLSGASGEQVTTQSIANYWGAAVFLSRLIGLPDQLWRLFARGAAPNSGAGVDSFFWPDRDEVYRLVPGSRAQEIGRDKFLKVLLPQLRSLTTGYDDIVTAVYDNTKQEWLMSVNAVSSNPSIRREPFVFSPRRGEWGGEYGHSFDRYVVHRSKLYGMRGMQSWELDGGGFEQSGQTMSVYGEGVFVPQPGIRHEAQSFRFHPSKPTRVEVYDKDHNLVFFTDQATQEAYEAGTGADWILQIDGWEQLMGRKNASIDPDQNRIQDEVFYLRVYFDNEERSILADAQLQLQQLI